MFSCSLFVQAYLYDIAIKKSCFLTTELSKFTLNNEIRRENDSEGFDVNKANNRINFLKSIFIINQTQLYNYVRNSENQAFYFSFKCSWQMSQCNVLHMLI